MIVFPVLNSGAVEIRCDGCYKEANASFWIHYLHDTIIQEFSDTIAYLSLGHHTTKVMKQEKNVTSMNTKRTNSYDNISFNELLSLDESEVDYSLTQQIK